jgi:hypothetical protein
VKSGVIILLCVLLALSFIDRDRRPVAAIQDTTAVHPADYSTCVTIRNAPLGKPKINLRGATPSSELV